MMDSGTIGTGMLDEIMFAKTLFHALTAIRTLIRSLVCASQRSNAQRYAPRVKGYNLFQAVIV